MRGGATPDLAAATPPPGRAPVALNPGGSGLTTTGDEQRWYESASTGVIPAAVNCLRPKQHAYITWSVGPDREDDFNDNNNWPYAGENDPCPTNLGYLNYSATNGTKSRGDIEQLNGSQNIGFYCIDHHIRVSGSRKL